MEEEIVKFKYDEMLKENIVEIKKILDEISISDKKLNVKNVRFIEEQKKKILQIESIAHKMAINSFIIIKNSSDNTDELYKKDIFINE